MTVGIDARSLRHQPTGVGRYVRNLLTSMTPLLDHSRSEGTAGIDLRVYVPAGSAGTVDGRVRVVELGAALLDNIVTWSHVRLPLQLLRHPVDLLHAPFYTLPAFCPCPAVVTIHDITFDLHPEWYTRRARIAFGGFARASARKARHVLTVSERSRSDIIAAYGVPPDHVTAVPLAPDPLLKRVEDPSELGRVRAKYAQGSEYALHVGSITPRRNIGRLLDAFAAVRRRARDLVLVLAGRVEPPSGPIEADIRRRGLEGAVRVAGYVEAADLPALYSAASVVVYPSLYEGFGLPVIEAMACGVPALASTGSCFEDLVGDAALLIDPTDTAALEEGIWAILSDTTLRGRLIERGLARAAGYTWERTARETLEVYRRAGGL